MTGEPMTDAEVREALARAERATGGECIVRNRYSHGGGRMYREDGPARDLILDVYDEANREFYFAARTDVPRLAADLLAARAERDLALSLRNTATNVLADVVAHRDSLAARCRELEGFVRDFLHTTSGKKSLDGAPLGRLESAAQRLLSPPPSPEATPVEDIVATIAATVPGEHVASLHGSQEIKDVPNRWAWSCRCGARSKRADMTIAEAKADHRTHVMSAPPAETVTQEAAKCATCGGEGGVSRIEAVGHDEYGDLVGEAVSEPCPDCHGCGGGA